MVQIFAQALLPQCLHIIYNNIKLFETSAFNLIVLDINLPGINGYDVCKMVRAKDYNIPVIMLTAFSSLNDKIEGCDCGADDYIVKPFEFKELLMKIRVLLKRAITQPVPAGTTLPAGDLVMNLDSKEVKRGDAIINLTAKEISITGIPAAK